MAGSGSSLKVEQRHGKGRVRVSRVWRNADGHGNDLLVEWSVFVSLATDCLPAYISSDNSSIVATDSMKNTVYVKAKECSEVVSAEEFAIILANHFTTVYPQVETANVRVVQKPWERLLVGSQPHSHGFKLGSEKRTAEVVLKKNGALTLTSGIEELAVLKTTKSGFEGFVRDKYTILPDTKERILATSVTASWRYTFERFFDTPPKLFCFTRRHEDIKQVLIDTFFGPPTAGVYSPSVQNTLYLMAKAILDRFPDVDWVQLRMPNLHFLPVNLSTRENPNMVKFQDDVYVPTDEPHGTIEAIVSRSISRM